MASVTGRSRSVKQPRGGYLNPKELNTIFREDGLRINPEENIHGSVVGMAVDYMTRFLLGSPLEEAFAISISGASIAQSFFGVEGAVDVAKGLLDGIHGLDNNSIISACKLVSFDVWHRDSYKAALAKGYDEINPDELTIKNIQVFIRRCVSLFTEFGPIVESEITFEPEKSKDEYGELDFDESMVRFFGTGTFGGYTGTVNSGDADYITKDTLWDVKVIKTKITNKHTLQLLMYWIMGQHSGREIFKDIKRIAIFNPRFNSVHVIDTANISTDVIHAIEDDVICYRGEYSIKRTGNKVCAELIDSNGALLLNLRPYSSVSSCKSGIKSAMQTIIEAGVDDSLIEGIEKIGNPKFELYYDEAGKCHFNLKSKSGRVIATGLERNSKEECFKDIERIKKNADASIKVE